MLLASIVIQLTALVTIGSKVSGGDAHTYIALSRDWESLDRVLSPNAFFGDLGPLSEVGNFWPAGYPAFLSLFNDLGEQWLVLVRLLQIAMVLGIAYMMSLIARRISANAGKWTFAVAALSPTLIWAAWTIGYELLLGFLLVLATYLIYRSTRHPILLGAASGALAGLALIVQFRAVLVIPIMCYLAWSLSGIRSFVAFGSTVVSFIAAWAMRTYVAMGTPVPWSANGPYNLWNGNGPHADGTNIFPLPPPEGGLSLSEASIEWILANPSKFFDLVARKALISFYPTEVADVSNSIPAEGIVSVAQWAYSFTFVTLLLLFGTALIWRRDLLILQLWPVAAIGVALVLPSLIFIALPRYRIPAEPFLIPVVVGTALELLRLRRPPQDSPSRPGAPLESYS